VSAAATAVLLLLHSGTAAVLGVLLPAVSSPATAIWFSVSGEMGLSNYLYSKEWKQLLDDTRKQLRTKQWKVRASAGGWQLPAHTELSCGGWEQNSTYS